MWWLASTIKTVVHCPDHVLPQPGHFLLVFTTFSQLSCQPRAQNWSPITRTEEPPQRERENQQEVVQVCSLMEALVKLCYLSQWTWVSHFWIRTCGLPSVHPDEPLIMDIWWVKCIGLTWIFPWFLIFSRVTNRTLKHHRICFFVTRFVSGWEFISQNPLARLAGVFWALIIYWVKKYFSRR